MLKTRISEHDDEMDERFTEIEGLKSAMGGYDDEANISLFSPRSSRKRPSRGAASAARKRLRRRRGSDSEDTDST
jgi:hypothetical protein